VAIVVENSRVPKLASIFFPITAITLGPFIFVSKGIERGTPQFDKLINHEKIHVVQQYETLIIGHWLLYLLFTLIGLVRYRSIYKAYRRNPFELEAYDNEHDLLYLPQRRLYSWFKRIWN
jgi:hypothetical protein